MPAMKACVTATLLAMGLITGAPAQIGSDTLAPKHKRLLAISAEMDRQSAPINTLLKSADFTGTLAISNGKGINSWAFERGTGLTPDKAPYAKLWRWASVTKQIVAVLVMQEVEAGRIDLDQPLSRYLPTFKSPSAKAITVRQLLRHQTGLPNPDDIAATPDGVSGFYAASYRGNRNPLTGYCAGKPKGKAGENWAYNNCDYMVAGALLEEVTGKPWHVLVQDRIAKPLGLKTLAAFPTDTQTRTGLIGGKPEPDFDLGSFGGSAGLFGSVDDLIKFDHALMSGKLLNPQSLQTMWDGQPKLGFMALGQWVFDASIKGCEKPVRLVERRGAIGGVAVRNFMIPEKNLAVVVFSDKAEGDFAFGEIWQGSGFSHDLLSLAACS